MLDFGLALIVIFVLVFLSHWGKYSNPNASYRPPVSNPDSNDYSPSQTINRSHLHLYDAGNCLIATIYNYPNHQEIYSVNGIYKGRYDFHTNQTLNSHNVIVCYGNALSSLV